MYVLSLPSEGVLKLFSWNFIIAIQVYNVKAILFLILMDKSTFEIPRKKFKFRVNVRLLNYASVFVLFYYN